MPFLFNEVIFKLALLVLLWKISQAGGGIYEELRHQRLDK